MSLKIVKINKNIRIKKGTAMSNTLYNKLCNYAENDLNVLLIGTHGIGKTTLVKQLAEKFNYKMKYYSSSTLDPWADLVGVPVPNNSTKSLEFYRPADLEDAEFVFFDELNRAHPRVLNAVLEIIQFKSINGKKLKNLRMVWAAINPPGGEYNVEDLDPALTDRFHIFVRMKAEINMEYMKGIMADDTAKVLNDWWNNDCDDKQRACITPRRIEYLGRLIENGIQWRDALPVGHTFPSAELVRRLESISKGEYDTVDINMEAILSNVDKFTDSLKKDLSLAFKLKDFVVKMNSDELFKVKDILELMPPDILDEVSRKRFRKLKAQFYQHFKDGGIKIETSYPRINKAFKFELFNTIKRTL